MSKQSYNVKHDLVMETLSPTQDALESSLELSTGNAVHIEMPVLGTLINFTKAGQPVVKHKYSEKEVECLSTVKMKFDDLQKNVLLVFVEGDTQRPIITGLIEDTPLESGPKVISSDEGLIFRARNASLEMDISGNIFIEGRTINTQAYATNRIKGGSVKIN